MSFEWNNLQLTDLAKFKYGKFLAKSQLDKSGFVVFSGYGVVGYLPTYQFDEPQLLIVCRGEGGTGDVKMSPSKCSITNLSIVLSPNEKLVSKKFLYWALKASDTHRLRTGSAQAQIVIGALEKFRLTIPSDKAEQERIAQTLDSLDDRISLLRETNTTLEAIAQAVFKSWFVDFDPVRVKQQGSDPQGMDAATAALFPDSFEASELGEVPKGWRVGKIEQSMELAYGKALKALDRTFGAVPVYGSGGVTGYHNEALVNIPSIVIGRKGTVGSLYWEDRPFFPIDTVFYVKTKTPLTYCFYLLQTLGLEGMNTDGAVPGLNRNNVYRLPIVMPTKELLAAFDAIALPLRQKIFSNAEQAQTLATLRDTLLPRLISGQLRLPEAQEALEETAA